MSLTVRIPIYKMAPFIRLLLPLVCGILLQFQLQIQWPVIVLALFGFSMANGLFYLLPLSLRFKLRALQGILITILLLAFGWLITWQKDARHKPSWYGNYYKEGAYIIARINEPLIEKPGSYKAECIIEQVIIGDSSMASHGKLLVYFSKDSGQQLLQYGDRIIFNKNLQRIKNTGNPGAFDYERYAAFQQEFHNVFLKTKDYQLLAGKKISRFIQFVFTARESILMALRQNISSGKDELGIAEALLIGYTNDLDKDLVQAYSNTGVVHIIAISGMHLGLIYVMLVWIFARIPLIKRSKLVQVILILSCLWLFSLLTGASASVLRSAVMFTFITVGNNLAKKSSIYNSLAASAFVLLCYNPYFLWDVGFQLSYLAIVGIVVFQQPIYHLFYVSSTWLDNIWKLVAVSLAAQVLTFPICLYYFHQFPNLFLITNIIAVPLSSLILYAEIFLAALSWIPFVGIYLGKITGWLVWLMNTIIVTVNHSPFAVWDKIPATVVSTLLLYAVVIGAGAWLIKKNNRLLKCWLYALLVFLVIADYNKWLVKNQQKMIVYNIQRCQAIDLVNADTYQFIGDSILSKENMLQNFNLKPGRIALQLNKQVDSIDNCFHYGIFFQFENKRIAVIDKPLAFELPPQRINVDIIIISRNPKLYIPELARVFNCTQYIADASNSLWKIANWKKDCETLHLQLHSIPEKGAFILDL